MMMMIIIQEIHYRDLTQFLTFSVDIGGSIRMPSFFNGIFGHKPSPDVVPNIGQFPDATGNRQQFLCTGPMCRYAEDLKPLLMVRTV